jgi:hypothetical protein
MFLSLRIPRVGAQLAANCPSYGRTQVTATFGITRQTDLSSAPQEPDRLLLQL